MSNSRQNKLITVMGLVNYLFSKHNIEYFIYGSSAAILHGVKFPEEQLPGDIDITVKKIGKAWEIIEDLANQRSLQYKVSLTVSNPIMKRFEIILPALGVDSPGVKIDLTCSRDFGFNNVKHVSVGPGKVEKPGDEKNSAPVISVIPVIDLLREYYSHSLGRGMRPKDTTAVVALLQLHPDEIDPNKFNSNDVDFLKFILAHWDVKPKAENSHVLMPRP